MSAVREGWMAADHRNWSHGDLPFYWTDWREDKLPQPLPVLRFGRTGPVRRWVPHVGLGSRGQCTLHAPREGAARTVRVACGPGAGPTASARADLIILECQQPSH